MLKQIWSTTNFGGNGFAEYFTDYISQTMVILMVTKPPPNDGPSAVLFFNKFSLGTPVFHNSLLFKLPRCAEVKTSWLICDSPLNAALSLGACAMYVCKLGGAFMCDWGRKESAIVKTNLILDAAGKLLDNIILDVFIYNITCSAIHGVSCKLYHPNLVQRSILDKLW